MWTGKVLALVGAIAINAVAMTDATAQGAGMYFMKTLGKTRMPEGHVSFCVRHPGDCSTQARAPQIHKLTEKTWRELLAVNNVVNISIRPVTDIELHNRRELWSYPSTMGDCEDYVLLKRKLLIGKGWDPSSLLITVVLDQRGDGHAVLTVRTDRGDFILDNQDQRVLLWSETPYRYIKRQSARVERNWVAISDNRATLVASIN